MRFQICLFVICTIFSKAEANPVSGPSLLLSRANNHQGKKARGRCLPIRGGAGGLDPSTPFRSPGIHRQPTKNAFKNRPFRTWTSPNTEQQQQQESSAQSEHFVTDLQQRDSRLGFIRKVYGILGVQLLTTLATVLFFNSNRQLVRGFLRGPGGSALTTLSMLGSFFVIILFQMRPSLQTAAPANFLLLGLFTAFESILVGTITLMYRSHSVMLALAQCAAVTTGLSLYAWQPNPQFDLSSLGSMCVSSLFVLVGASVLSFVFRFPLNDVVMSSLGALVFSAFIVYDTKRITDGSHPQHSLQSHQYIMGALALYLDIVNLFIHLLRLFGERERS
mmetsp:Transcript_34480/g.68476  ORF Transcript_34480/g.68476 Transcript_34480/m.68476 type:complete len:334 (+) Transcript_34480:48-1049(+)